MLETDDNTTAKAYEMLEEPVLQVMRELGVTAALAGLSNHVASILNKMHTAGKIDVDVAIETIRAVAKTGSGSVSFAVLNG